MTLPTHAEPGSSPDAASPAARLPQKLRRAGRVLLAVTAPLTFVVVGGLMAGHWYDMPRPAASDPVTIGALNALRSEDDGSRLLAVHVLYAGCRCSERILNHLLVGKRPAGVSEKILFVGAGSVDLERARVAGFGIERVAKRELEQRFHIVGVPLLALVAPDGEIRYLGGYSDTKQGPTLRDTELIVAARDGRTERTLPLFGCAVSRELQKLLDPLGLKYGDAS
jgi:hypothetical protein